LVRSDDVALGDHTLRRSAICEQTATIIKSTAGSSFQHADARRKKQRARRVEALSLKLAGVSTARIAQRMGIAPDSVRHLINRTLATAENRAAEEMRELENARLDRAQAAIWSNVLPGDYRAVMVFLQISQRRAKLNGLDSPASLAISPNARGEMERALFDLR
jgi:hypothetical protein